MGNKILYIVLISSLFLCHKDPNILSTKHAYFRNVLNKYTDTTLSILTYNIQLGFKSSQDPWDKTQLGASSKQIHDISEIIRKTNPNIVLLQEVPKNRCNTEIKNFIEILADSLNMNFAYGEHGPNDACAPFDGIWGNAILTKFPINKVNNRLILYKGKWRARSVLRTEIQINDEVAINVYNLHHDGRDENEMANTINFIKQSKLAVIVGGDFNRIYGNEQLDLMKLNDVFNSSLTGIDRVYCSLDSKVLKIGTVPKSNIVSDHVACYTMLKIN